MAHVSVTITCRHRWWLKYYLAGVLVVSHLIGRKPDPARVSCWVKRGITLKVR